MRRVLIIAYYWPPAGGAGVQRVLKYAKYLPQFGWEPVILTVNSPDSPIEDLSLLDDISPNTKVYKTKALEPFNLYKKITGKKTDEKISSDILVDKTKSSFAEKVSRWIRLNVFIPDAKIGWIPYAVKKGMKIIEEENIELIFSSSPPHTVQVIGQKLANKSKLKWVADFRDPWLELIHYQANKRLKFVQNYEAKLEKKVLVQADSLITVSAAIKKMFFNKTNRTDVHVIPNGFDESDITVTQSTFKNEFIITYTGIISDTKIPTPLFYAVKKMTS
ncbi:MAG: glycosyltransferase, partial [Melioribacteraceae bacterium]|nr:glycosyltransferase [Melioribacteraceae bacterium]